MNDRLYRSVDDRVIAGVCGGLAVRLAIDPSLVRIGYAVLAFVTGIFPLLVLYVIMAAVVPEEPTGFAGLGRSPTPGPDAVPGWMAPSSGGWPPADQPGPGVNGSLEPVPAEATAPAASPAATGPGAAQPTPSAWAVPPLPRRSSDPLLAVIGGLALVGLGVYFLLRDQVSVDWGVVAAAGLMALGVVVIVAAVVRPRR
jgi:phage shock protein C